MKHDCCLRVHSSRFYSKLRTSYLPEIYPPLSSCSRAEDPTNEHCLRLDRCTDIAFGHGETIDCRSCRGTSSSTRDHPKAQSEQVPKEIHNQESHPIIVEETNNQAVRQCEHQSSWRRLQNRPLLHTHALARNMAQEHAIRFSLRRDAIHGAIHE